MEVGVGGEDNNVKHLPLSVILFGVREMKRMKEKCMLNRWERKNEIEKGWTKERETKTENKKKKQRK